MERAINVKEIQAKFLIRQMVMGKVTYLECITSRTDLKEEIDRQLALEGLEHLKEPVTPQA